MEDMRYILSAAMLAAAILLCDASFLVSAVLIVCAAAALPKRKGRKL